MDFGYFTLSDNHYANNDRTANAFVADILDEAVYAEEVGLHSAWIGEHHFSTLGVSSSQRPGLETDFISASLEQRHGAYRDAGEETPDAIVIPHPSALEVGKLEFAAFGPPKQLLQGRFGATEIGVFHQKGSFVTDPLKADVNLVEGQDQTAHAADRSSACSRTV